MALKYSVPVVSNYERKSKKPLSRTSRDYNLCYYLLCIFLQLRPLLDTTGLSTSTMPEKLQSLGLKLCAKRFRYLLER